MAYSDRTIKHRIIRHGASANDAIGYLGSTAGKDIAIFVAACALLSAALGYGFYLASIQWLESGAAEIFPHRAAIGIGILLFLATGGIGVFFMLPNNRYLARRRLAEPATKRDEDHLRDSAEAATDWIWRTGPDHKLTYLSSGIRAINIAPERCLGKSYRELADDIVEAADNWSNFSALLEKHQPFRTFIFRLTRDDGSACFVGLGAKPLFDEAGRFLGHGGGGRDVTVDVTAQQALRDAKNAAESASHGKSHFLSAMSHKMRTQLHNILGFSEVMSAQILGPLGDPKYLAYANDIHMSGQYLLSVIDDVIDIAKIENKQLKMRDDTIYLPAMLKECHQVVEHLAAAARVELAVEVGPLLPRLWADEQRIKQVMRNLLTNAIKFTASGGRVTFSASARSNGSLVLWVADTGIGMSEYEIRQALQPFRQIDSAIGRRHDGTGLGLPLAKALVELHGGKFAIDSTPGQGTIVSAIFPHERILGETKQRIRA